MAGQKLIPRRGKRVRKGPVTTLPGQHSVLADPLNLAAAPAKGPAGLTVLGVEFDVLGSIYIDAHVRLEGTIDGEIRCTELDITQAGFVRGRIVAERVTIYGTVVDGSIYANVLILRPGCSVEAEIYHKHLQLETGSYFEGKSRRVEDPTGMAPT